MIQGRNELVPMTRRYFDLPQKVAKRDSDFAKKMIQLQDNPEEILNLFLKEHKNLSDYRYWEILRTIWIICGATDRLSLFLPLFTSKRKQRYCFSTPEEAKKLRELPEPLNVFRATNEGQSGISWTIDKNYALHFQQMFNKDFIEERWVSKKEVFALIDRNNEAEILIL
jgi:hypothetical protein